MKATGVHEHNKDWLSGFLRAAGEELGWRSFLLPCLMTTFDPTMSILIRYVPCHEISHSRFTITRLYFITRFFTAVKTDILDEII